MLLSNKTTNRKTKFWSYNAIPSSASDFGKGPDFLNQMVPKQNKTNRNFPLGDKPNRELLALGPRCFDQWPANQIQNIRLSQKPIKIGRFVCRGLNVPAVVQWNLQKQKNITRNKNSISSFCSSST